MRRNRKKCSLCGEEVSFSNFNRHHNSLSCKNGGKNRTKKEVYPWRKWEIQGGIYKLPCGYVGNKISCRNKLITDALGSNINLKEHNKKIKQGVLAVHNLGKQLPSFQRAKLSEARREYHQRFGVSDETRKKLSAHRRAYLANHPEAHVNARVAGNRSKMTYPEQVAFDWFQKNSIIAIHNKRVGSYYPDFLVGNVVVEIDGRRWHSSEDQKARDRKRDLELQSMGYKVYRIWADDRIEDGLENIFAL